MRQPALFVLAGGLQYLLDATLFGLLTAAGWPTTAANVSSRVTAATMGFVVNRYWTFEQRNETFRRLVNSLARFTVLFVVMTALSTVSLIMLEASFGNDVGQKVLYKLGVEAVLAILSFLVSKHWVFRR